MLVHSSASQLYMSVFPCTHTTEKDIYESFQEFFECWMFEQNQHLKELLAAESTHLTDEQVQALNGRVIEHYEHYYTAKLSCAKQDVLAMFSPTWLSSLEKAFLWIGG